MSGREVTEVLTVSAFARDSYSRGEGSLADSVFLGYSLGSFPVGIMVITGGGLAWGIIGGRILGVVRLIFCFFSFSASLGAGAGAGVNFGAGFSSS